jgi:hypothetical protein
MNIDDDFDDGVDLDDDEHDERPLAANASLTAFLTALVYVWLRTSEKGPVGPMPAPPPAMGHNDEFHFECARRLSTWLGQPPRCHAPTCRRTRICQGHPPQCWRDDPPPTHREIELVRSILQYQIERARLKPRPA